LVADDTERIGADVRLADVVAEDHEDVGLLGRRLGAGDCGNEGCEPDEQETKLHGSLHLERPYFSKAKIFFQSFFMSTTIQPRLTASSHALSSFPMWDVRSYAHSRSASVWWTRPMNRTPLPAAVHSSIC